MLIGRQRGSEPGEGMKEAVRVMQRASIKDLGWCFFLAGLPFDLWELGHAVALATNVVARGDLHWDQQEISTRNPRC